MQTYISVDDTSRISNQVVKLENNGNEISGTLKTKDNDDNEVKDINNIFIKKSSVKNLEPIDTKDDAKEDFTLKSVAAKVNELINLLKGNSTNVLLLGLVLSIPFAGHAETKKFGTIGSREQVVIREEDPNFTAWTNKTTILSSESDPIFQNMATNNSNLSLGYGSYAVDRSIAIGLTKTISNDSPDYMLTHGFPWKNDYTSNAQATNYSVAIGPAAKALQNVSVAVGQQAHVSGIHTDTGITQYVTLKNIEVVIEQDSDGKTIGCVTNDLPVETITYDIGKFERFPNPNENWSYIDQKVENLSSGGKKTTQRFRQSYTYLADPLYVTPDVYAQYDRLWDTAQGVINYKDAIYGIALGSRATVGGYHSMALGHWTRAARPHTIAVGPSSHVFTDGGVVFGYDSKIQENSPYSLAVGSKIQIPQNMTNAIVIGVPSVKYSKRVDSLPLGMNGSPDISDSTPTAMKPNSINMVCNGDGLQDFFIDNKSITERLAGEVRVIGNVVDGANPDIVASEIEYLTGVSKNEDNIVFKSEAGIHLFTGEFTGIDNNQNIVGMATNIWINGKSLKDVIVECASAQNSELNSYKELIRSEADRATKTITNATDLAGIKSALTNFFNNIK